MNSTTWDLNNTYEFNSIQFNLLTNLNKSLNNITLVNNKNKNSSNNQMQNTCTKVCKWPNSQNSKGVHNEGEYLSSMLNVDMVSRKT